MLEIILVILLLKSCKDLLYLAVTKMGDGHETNLPAEHQKEWNFVDKKYIGRQVHFLV